MPDGFRFAVKMPRAITVFGRTGDVPAFCERVRALGDRLGPLLVRPADDRKRDDDFLGALLDGLDDDLRAAFDLRHPSWDGVEALLEGRNAVRVNQFDTPAPFRYLRLREPPYDDAALGGVGGAPAPAARRRARGALLLHARGRAARRRPMRGGCWSSWRAETASSRGGCPGARPGPPARRVALRAQNPECRGVLAALGSGSRHSPAPRPPGATRAEGPRPPGRGPMSAIRR